MDQEATDLSKKVNRDWQQRLLRQLLRREAEALLKRAGANQNKPKEKEKPSGKTP